MNHLMLTGERGAGLDVDWQELARARHVAEMLEAMYWDPVPDVAMYWTPPEDAGEPVGRHP